MRRFGVVQYLRPEIPGFVLGSFIAAYAFGEFRARGGSTPLVRFLLGAFFMRGTGDTITGLVSAFAYASLELHEAAIIAARASRMAGKLA